MGGDLWANATQTHVSALSGQGADINPLRGIAGAQSRNPWLAAHRMLAVSRLPPEEWSR